MERVRWLSQRLGYNRHLVPSSRAFILGCAVLVDKVQDTVASLLRDAGGGRSPDVWVPALALS